MVWPEWSHWLIRQIKSLHPWLIVIFLGLCTVPQYSEQLGIFEGAPFSSLFGLARYSAERILYLVPIIYAGHVLGTKGGIATSVASLFLMLPRALFISPTPHDALLETAMVTLFGLLSCLYIRAQRGWREQKEKDLVGLRFYVQQAVRSQEEERKRIARELHDDTAQVLASLSRQLDNLIQRKHRLPASDIATLKDLQEQINSGLQGVYRLSQDLRPSLLDDLGLIPALRSLTKNLQEHDGIVTDLKILGSERRFLPEVEIGVFRIVQEALNNIRRHAHASEAQVVIEFAEGSTKVTISDSGQGFQLSGRVADLPRSGKLGLAGMQERAQLLGGTLEVQSIPGKGTTLTVEIPT